MNYLQYNAGTGSKENWVVREAVFDPRYLGKCESIFCLGNGYLNVGPPWKNDMWEKPGTCW